MALGQRTVRSGGRPSANWSRRGVAITNVSRPGPQAGGATTSPSGLRGLTQNFSMRELLNGPAMRPNLTPLAVENSVGESAADRAPNAGNRERERGALPSPIWPLPGRKVGQGLLAFWGDLSDLSDLSDQSD